VSANKRLILSSALACFVVAVFATTSDAQVFRRGPVGRVVVVGGFYSPFWVDPWYGFGYPWGYPPYYRTYLPPEASVKFEVKPNEAQVYIDGYYAGIVDDFDGAFQRLHVQPGEHEIELYLQGYRTVRQKAYLTADNTFKVKYNMERLGPGEQPEPPPEPINPPPPPPQQAGQPPMPPPGYPQQQPRGPVGRRMPPPPPQGQGPRGGQQPQSGYGTLAVRVQPSDVEISIDGEPWRGPAGQDRLVVEVSEGSHTIEIRKQGFRTYVTQVDIRRGETTPLNVSLRGEQ
jgi:PEGA domain